MARKNYSEDDKRRFVEVAEREGISPAMKKLQYPGSYNTASKWLSEAGVVIAVDTLKSKAAEMRAFYGQKEQMYSLQSMLDTIQTKLEYENLSPDAISKLAGAMQKVITTMELVGGRVTNRTESWDGVDRTILDGLAKAQERNEMKRLEIEASLEEEDISDVDIEDAVVIDDVADSTSQSDV